MNYNLAAIFIIIVLFGFVSCNYDNSCKFEKIIPVENYDTLKPGETYLAEIKIPDFDSTLYYQCIIGDYDTIIDSNICKLEMGIDKNYILLYQPDNFYKNGTYIIVSIKQNVGRHFYKGYIRANDNKGNEQYFTFKCDYFVTDNNN